eukprot:268767_1
MQYTYNKLQDELQECNLAIQLSTGPQHEEIKVDTRPRSTDDDHAYDQQDEKEIRSMNFQDFMAPVVDDYIDCEKDLMNCPVVNRILHLLKYYKNIQSQSDMSLYEYMVTLDDNYGIPDVMEDWYHFKLQHPLIRTDFKYFENSVEINCVNKKQCICLKRYHRERGGEYYQLNSEIDHKNAILTDQMDSIHAYIFHSCASRLRIGLQNQYVMTIISDQEQETKDHSSQNIFENNPQSLVECNVSQIIHIANHTIPDLNKLQPMQQEIVAYIQQNQLDGNKLTNIGRKKFMKDAAAHFRNKKLTTQFGKLYTGIVKCDINEFSPKQADIWSNDPKSISECNVDQIVYILNHNIIENLNNSKLKSYKSDIIEFIRETKFNGGEIVKKRKEFILQMKRYLKNNKLAGNIANLHKQIITYDLSPFITENNSKQDAVTEHHNSENNSKFITPNSDINTYSFGTQYRYTPNLSHHPLYIKPKYNNLKEELIEYSKITNKQIDENQLFNELYTNIQSFDSAEKSILLELVTNEINNESKMVISNQIKAWWTNNYTHKSSDDSVLKMTKNCVRMNEMLRLFHYVPNDVQFHSLNKLLDFSYEQLNSDLYQRLTHYFTTRDNSAMLNAIKGLIQKMNRGNESAKPIQTEICKILTNVYQIVFADNLKPYLIVNKYNYIPWHDNFKNIIVERESDEKYQTNETESMKKIIDILFYTSEINKKRFYEVNVKGENCKTLFSKLVKCWLD